MLRAIRVTYFNEHYSEGPIQYDCSDIWGDLICMKDTVVFVIHDSTRYLWHSKLYDTWAEFELSK